MPLFTDPVVLNNGTTDETFDYQKQETIGKSTVHTWKRIAAESLQRDTLKAKYSANPFSGVLRNVTQRNIMLPIADGTLRLATINISGAFHAEHSIDDLTLLGISTVAGAAQTDYWLNFFNQM